MGSTWRFALSIREEFVKKVKIFLVGEAMVLEGRNTCIKHYIKALAKSPAC